MSQNFKIRKATKDDVNFVFSVWLRSYKHDSPITKYTLSDTFYDFHQRQLDEILSQPSTEVYVACDVSDDTLIFGFIAFRPVRNIIDYIYVKKPFRRFGIAKALLAQADPKINLADWAITHITYGALDILFSKNLKFNFNPYLLSEGNL